MRLSIGRPRHATVVAYLALFLALGGSAYAVGGGSEGASATINACYSKGSGELRIPKGRKCRPGERQLTWNREGRPGASGATGAAGPQGPAGTKGAAGAKGATGSQGPVGAQGPTGLKGDTGSQGETGPQGEAGPRGETGPRGPQGSVNTTEYFNRTESIARFADSNLFGNPVNSRVGTVAKTGCFVGEILLFAGDLVPTDLHLADGSLLPIENTALFSVLGTQYGGDGVHNFALPDLRAADPKGAGPMGANYYICTTGEFPE